MPRILNIVLVLSFLVYGARDCAFAQEINSPVVIELFTSQGYSGCPRAEEILAQLSQTYGPDLICLAFHVDYWNHLGWKDPYSLKESTRRQQSYQRFLRSDTLYAPQAVIQGDLEFPGQDKARIETAILKYSAFPLKPMKITFEETVIAGEYRIVFEIPEDLLNEDFQLSIIVYENGPEDIIQEGQNAGLSLKAPFAVRKINHPDQNSSGYYSVLFKPDMSWDLHRSGVVILAQNERMKIVSAGKFYPFIPY